MSDSSRPPLTEVLARHTPSLMSQPGVVGTAESQLADGTPCILVLLARKDAALERSLPRTLEGWPVKIEITGEIRALPDSGQ